MTGIGQRGIDDRDVGHRVRREDDEGGIDEVAGLTVRRSLGEPAVRDGRPDQDRSQPAMAPDRPAAGLVRGHEPAARVVGERRCQLDTGVRRDVLDHERGVGAQEDDAIVRVDEMTDRGVRLRLRYESPSRARSWSPCRAPLDPPTRPRAAHPSIALSSQHQHRPPARCRAAVPSRTVEAPAPGRARDRLAAVATACQRRDARHLQGADLGLHASSVIRDSYARDGPRRRLRASVADRGRWCRGSSRRSI